MDDRLQKAGEELTAALSEFEIANGRAIVPGSLTVNYKVGWFEGTQLRLRWVERTLNPVAGVRWIGKGRK